MNHDRCRPEINYPNLLLCGALYGSASLPLQVSDYRLHLDGRVWAAAASSSPVSLLPSQSLLKPQQESSNWIYNEMQFWSSRDFILGKCGSSWAHQIALIR